jgi:hypothetical protein
VENWQNVSKINLKNNTGFTPYSFPETIFKFINSLLVRTWRHVGTPFICCVSQYYHGSGTSSGQKSSEESKLQIFIVPYWLDTMLASYILKVLNITCTNHVATQLRHKLFRPWCNLGIYLFGHSSALYYIFSSVIYSPFNKSFIIYSF